MLDVRRRVLAQSGPLARCLRAENVWRPAWRERRLAVARDAGLGDVLMVTPLLREARRRNPALHTVFYTTKYAALLEGLPYIGEVRPFADRPADAIYLRYEDALPPRATLPQIFADSVGLKLTDTVPDCVVDTARVARFRDAWANCPAPYLLVLRRASAWTPNKDWADRNWLTLAERLGASATIVEIGEADPALAPIRAPHYIDLRGQTDLAGLAAAIAAATLYIGPVSGPMHIAAAVGTPSVTICGGYEGPGGFLYPDNRMLHTAVPCAPCWLVSACPNGLACLTAITVDVVEQAVGEMLARVKAAKGRKEALLF